MRGCAVICIFLLLCCAPMYATPARIIGMGFLDLIVDDESNRLNLFDYGRNIAGLYRDERGSTVYTSIAYGTVKQSDSGGALESEITYWGVALLSETSMMVSTLSRFPGVPIGAVVTYRMEDRLAISGSGLYSKTTTHSESAQRTEEASWPIGGVAFSRKLGVLDVGARGEYTMISISNNQGDLAVNGSLKLLEGGVAANLSPMLDIGVSAGFGFPDAGFTLSNVENNFSGNSVSAGLQGILSVPGLLKVGAKFDFFNANLSGETTYGNVTINIGDISLTDFSFGSRLLFSSILFPLKAGLSIDYKTTHPQFDGEDLSFLDFDYTQSSTHIGTGMSYAMPFLTPGIQYTLLNENISDNLDNGETVNSSRWDLRFGGEARLTVLSLRAGYIISRHDPNTGTDDDEFKGRSITVGTGLQIPLQPFKVEIAFVNQQTNPEDYRETENSLSAVFKMRF